MLEPLFKVVGLSAVRNIRSKKQEHFLCLTIGSDMRLIACHTVFIGTLTCVFSHPREIFAVAIEDRAIGIIVAHNHPSGSAIPSERDITTTRQLVAAGQLLGIPVMDHVIMAKHEHFSFRKFGLINSGDTAKKPEY